MKFGDITLNFGKGRIRSTYNLGNGFRYVKTRTFKKKQKRQEYRAPVHIPEKIVEKIEPTVQVEREPTWHELSKEQQHDIIMKYVATHSAVKPEKKLTWYEKMIRTMLMMIFWFMIVYLILAVLFNS